MTNTCFNRAATLPVLLIPSSAKHYLDISVSFEIKTDTGAVRVEMFKDDVRCEGSERALMQAGITLTDWIIVGRDSWCVMLSGASAQMRIGGRGRPKGQYMYISTGRETGIYIARWYSPHAQKNLFSKWIEESLSRKAKYDHSRLQTSPSEFLERCTRYCDVFHECIFNELEASVFVHNKAVIEKISGAFAELRNVFAEGKILSNNNLQRDGNIIYLNLPAKQ